MLKYTDYDIVFQEIPDETTLAINLSLCPNGCKGCHSPQLMQDIGEELTEAALDGLLSRYGSAVTCVSLMGGDNDPVAVERMARYIKSLGKHSAWYSGRQMLPTILDKHCFDYIKVGPYIESLGPLNKPTTNQRLYKIEGEQMNDITSRFWKKGL